MISIIIPAFNAAPRLRGTLDALVDGAVGGFVTEVIVVDGGSIDETREIAEAFGAKVLSAPKGRGAQLRAGAEAARADWLLFLHADTLLERAWSAQAARFAERGGAQIGVFRLGLDAKGLAPRLVAAGANLRTRLLKSPYGDQGLLISRSDYDAIGGYEPIPLFEDVDILKRIRRQFGRKSVTLLPARAMTSAEKYERQGYARRVLKNAWLIMQYKAGVSPERLAEQYRV